MNRRVTGSNTESLVRITSRLLGLLLFCFIVPVKADTTADSLPFDDLRNATPLSELSPRDVVQIQMGALKQNTAWGDDQGIVVTFRFASPANKRITGPVDKFLKLVTNPAYRPMLDHKDAEIGEPKVDAEKNAAMIPVIVTASDEKRVGYLFVLSMQDGDSGESCQCWMTDQVSRIELPKDRRESI